MLLLWLLLLLLLCVCVCLVCVLSVRVLSVLVLSVRVLSVRVFSVRVCMCVCAWVRAVFREEVQWFPSAAKGVRCGRQRPLLVWRRMDAADTDS